MSGGPEEWLVERVAGPAAALHEEAARLVSGGAPARRRVRLQSATRPAIVLGSGQPEGDVSAVAAAQAGVDIARRRSGGGAVLVGPGHVVWVDLILPAGDPLWDPDVGRAAWWVGEAWAAALSSVASGGSPASPGTPEVWTGPLRSTEWSRRVCFAGVGPGEVLIDGRKVVGVSQRRTRRAALFQTALLVSWDPAALLDLLDLPPPDRVRAERELLGAAVGVGQAAAQSAADALLALLMQ